MSILDMIMGAGGGDAVAQMAGKLGISPEQAQAAMGHLVPGVAQGMQDNPGAVGDADHSQYANDPTHPDAVAAGSGILGQLMGGSGMQTLEAEAAAKTGIPQSVIASMLPMVATMLAGHAASGTGGAAGGGGLMGMLGGLLGGNKS